MKNNSQYAKLTRDQAIKEILVKFELWDNMKDNKILLAMEESFREGFLRGEEYEYNNK